MSTTQPKLIVQVGRPSGIAPDEDEIKSVRDALRGSFGEGVEIIVTDTDVNMMEVPGMEEYADEIADRVAERLREDEE